MKSVYSAVRTGSLKKAGLLWTSDQPNAETYLTIYNTQKRDKFMPPPTAGFEPVIAASERPQIHVLNCAATGIAIYYNNTL